MTTAIATALHRPTPLGSPPRTKPRFRQGLVARRRLVSRLVELPRAKIVSVAAPAGYGKTTLLSEWARHDERAFAWLTIDEHDSDPASLVAAIEYALEAVVPAGSASRAPLAAFRRGPQAALTRRLGRALEGRDPFVLVIDDVHLLESRASLDLLRSLAKSLPADAQLALGSRTEPALPLGRFRAHRLLVEIGPRDLAMTTTEAAALFSMAGLELDGDAVGTLVKRTDGWPAGLYLAAVSLLDQPATPEAIRRFGGDEVAIADYLYEEVLSGLSREALDFLTHATIMERLSGPACDAVLTRRDSARLLSDIARRTLLLVPLDRTGEAYRCPRLLSQALGGRRRHLDPERESDLHRRASEWYGAHGDDERAIEHAIASEDLGRAARLIWSKVPAYVARGHNSTLQRWLKRFTPEQIATEPRLALAATHSHVAMGELAEAQLCAASARRILHETPPRRRARDIEAGVALVRALLGTEGIIQMGKHAVRASKLEPDDSPWRATCCFLEGVSLHLAGKREAAEARLQEGVRRSVIAAPSVQTSCLAQLALLAVEREDWETAAAHVSRASAQVVRYGLGDYPATALVFAVSGLVHAQRGSMLNAHDDLRQAKRLLGTLHEFVPWYGVEVRVTLARARLRRGEVIEARELVADATRAARQAPEAPVLQEWVATADAAAVAVSDTAAGNRLSLTTAELRILQYLPTHLSFREIALRLYVSANTVKTQAHAVYRKLSASSRSEAVTRAAELGLIDG